MQQRTSLHSFLLLSFSMTALFLLGFNHSTNARDIMNTKSDSTTILGRWNITVDVNGEMIPSWLEVRHSGFKMLVGRFVGTEGSARPVSRIFLKDGVLSFSIPPQWQTEKNDLVVEGKLEGDHITGSMTFPDGKKHSWTAVKAPTLRRDKAPVWGKPIVLFDGKNLDSWHAMGDNQWKVEGGILRSPHAGSNLVTNQKFNDFKLHIEFRYPPQSNSGVYLRGRYEVQIIDSEGQEPSDILFGGVYGFLTPSIMAAKNPGEWQSYDITLVGRLVTIVANGIPIIQNAEIPGITGGAIDGNEGEPGPILLQGDHGSIDYRNIILTPAK